MRPEASQQAPSMETEVRPRTPGEGAGPGSSQSSVEPLEIVTEMQWISCPFCCPHTSERVFQKSQVAFQKLRAKGSLRWHTIGYLPGDTNFYAIKLNNYQDPSSIPSNMEKPGTVVCVCNPGIWLAERHVDPATHSNQVREHPTQSPKLRCVYPRRGWEVKSICCSCRGPGYGFQHLHSLVPKTPVEANALFLPT